MTDVAALLQLELENRAFFERSIPSRGDAYYSLENVRQTIQLSLEERQQGLSYMYLIRTAGGELVGRANLVEVSRSPVPGAELGYRLAERHQGKGHATNAVGLLVREAVDRYGLQKLEAVTTPGNIGSQIVLLRNGFQFQERGRDALLLHEAPQDSVRFEWHSSAELESAPARA